ncbi:Hypothetical protein LBF_1118 [Leptospira biflexa serovar Patoc strain 'Patoc 1 (Ames)']|uniref:Uncharacterized protein n=1 Tax=Leptospira biflexa serovar Patoc (strain Patoc 1 / ATCC 23582 / Paris) TaxID=456481 RepID=B0SNJ4_LEPBP|nr:hypothetical protein [Leptospira biflexa]ABZ93642.1 Hypothetical protein LBF_1118 [Leptospira biflexa serovar Patoc strain 'Patoc 1 (Ames)']ABZ97275.1 Hypothetical protein LEPBI_I1159 [Leptospira biflexa serovar Patoc strain 'Patoc 1 (Paris)']
MDSLFGAVLTQLPEPEKDLLLSWLQVNGLVVKECTSKNWKDFPNSVRMFSKPSPELAKELLDWSIEPILCGKFSSEEKQTYQFAGVSMLWDKPFQKIYTFPTQTLVEKKLTWVVFTKNQILDQNISLLLKSMGYKVYTEGNSEFLMKRLLVGPCHFLILDWDQLDAKNLVPQLQKIKGERAFLSIGIKDFFKEHLYRDLKMGISGISEVLVDKKDFWKVFLESFPLSEDSEEIKSWKETSRSVSKLSFSFQEKLIPVSMKQMETNIVSASPHSLYLETMDRIDLFRWLELF